MSYNRTNPLNPSGSVDTTDYQDTPTSAGSRGVQWTGMSQATFMSRVLPYFAGGLLVTAFGAHIGMKIGPGFLLLAIVLNLVFYFALLWNRHAPGLNVALYYSYTFVNGLLLGPLVLLATKVGGASIIIQALGLTAVGFFISAGYVYTTGKDMSGLGPFLVSGLLVIIIAGLVNIFVGGTGLSLGISILSVFLFMGFTAYDMSNIMFKFRDNEYMLATIELYLDFINLFVALLRILIYIAARRD